MKRVIIFIDGNHLFHRMWDHYKTHLLDIQDLACSLCLANRQLIQIRYYYSPFKKHINKRIYSLQQKYVTNISRHSNVQLIQGKYIRKPVLLKKSVMNKIKGLVNKNELETYVEKGVDVKIAVDLIHMASNNEYDTAVLVSGDSDFVPALDQVKKLKKKVQVSAFIDGANQCYDLKNHCKSVINLHHLIPVILRKQKSHTP